MDVKPLSDEEIQIGKAVDDPQGGSDPDVRGSIVQATGLDVFKGNCPLWTYILAEAFKTRTMIKIPVKEDRQISTPQLGPVGGRIVAEVFLGLLFGDNDSYLSQDPNWKPTITNGNDFRLKDFVNYALGK